MAEFSTASMLEVELDEASLARVNRQLSQGIEDSTVEVDAPAASLRNDAASGGGGLSTDGGRERSRQLRTMLDQDEYRNRLLDESMESGGDGGGNLRTLGGLGGLLAGGGLAIGIGGLVAQKAAVTAASLISDLAVINPMDVIGKVANINPMDVIASAASLTASAVIENPVSLAVGDLIESGVDLGAEAFLDVAIASGAALTTQQVLDHITDGGSGEPSGQGSGSGSGGGLLGGLPDVPPEALLGGGAVGIAGYLASQSGASLLAGGSLVPKTGSGGPGFPAVGVPIADQLRQWSQRDLIPDVGQNGEGATTGAMTTAVLGSTTGNAVAPATSGNDPLRVPVNVQNTIQVDASRIGQDIDREFDRIKRDIKRDIEAELPNLP